MLSSFFVYLKEKEKKEKGFISFFLSFFFFTSFFFLSFLDWRDL